MAILTSTQITGSLGITGQVSAGGITASFQGTATSASYAVSASYAPNLYPQQFLPSASWASSSISASYAPPSAPSNYLTYADASTSSLNWITASFANVFHTSSLAVAGIYSFTSSNHPVAGQYADTTIYITNTIVAATASLSFPATWVNMNGGWPTSITASKNALLSLRAIDTSTVFGTWALQP